MFLPFRLTLVFLSVLLLCYGVESQNATARIIGGTPANIAQNRYILSLRVNGIHDCGATLISPLYVVTAAHCIYSRQISTMTVVGGATRISERGVTRRIVKAVRPSGYDDTTLFNDIAVLKLASPMRGQNIRPIALCSGSWKAGDMVKVSGWGKTHEDNNSGTDELRSVVIPLMSKKTCLDHYRGSAKLSASMFCAADLGKRDSCAGDSGGPLVHKGRLCGVVSWGIGCGRTNFPGVYTSIRKMRGFIQRAMRI